MLNIYSRLEKNLKIEVKKKKTTLRKILDKENIKTKSLSK